MVEGCEMWKNSEWRSDGTFWSGISNFARFNRTNVVGFRKMVMSGGGGGHV